MRLLLAILLCIVAFPATAFAAWPPQGVRVTGAPGEEFTPEVVSDGMGGAYVSWTHLIPGTLDYDGYLQHLTATGEIAPGWPVNGLPVASGPGSQGTGARLSDGAGGVLLIISNTAHDPQGDLYLQRITAMGAVAPGWPAGGVPVVVAPGTQSGVSMVSDGAGGAWVIWQDRRDPAQIRGYYTHVLASGEIAPGWPENGRMYEPSLGSLVVATDMLATGDGGFLACASTAATVRFESTAMFARRHGPDGTVSPAWPAEPVLVCPERAGTRGAFLAKDGTGGLFAVWPDYRNWPPYYDVPDIYAQRIRGDGTRASGWPEDGLPVAAIPGVSQGSVTLCEDGRGGVYIAWEDMRAGYVQVYGQHLAGDGVPYPGWPAGGRPLSALPTWQLSPRLVWDGADGAYMSWLSFGASGYQTYVSHLTPYGTPAPGWAPEGVPASTLPGHYRPFITADGQGGAIVAWEQSFPGTFGDIYAQRFVRDGIVAAAVSLVSAEATPGEVRLVWRVSGAAAATVERRAGEPAGETAWEARASVAADGSSRLTYTDTDVVPGARYDYRLAFDGGTRGGLASVEVPASLALSLEGARPNPSRGAVQVAFTLPDGAPAQLALHDLAGRRMAARAVGGLGPGRHVVRLADVALAPGLYWATLTHGGHTLRARVVVVR